MFYLGTCCSASFTFKNLTYLGPMDPGIVWRSGVPDSIGKSPLYSRCPLSGVQLFLITAMVLITPFLTILLICPSKLQSTYTYLHMCTCHFCMCTSLLLPSVSPCIVHRIMYRNNFISSNSSCTINTLHS